MAQVSPQLKANLCRSTLGQLRIPDVPRRWFFESGYTLRVEGWVLSRRILERGVLGESDRLTHWIRHACRGVVSAGVSHWFCGSSLVDF